MPTALAVIVAIAATQIVMRRDNLWLPGFILRLKVPDKRLQQATDWLKPWAEKLDRTFQGHLPALATPKVVRVAAAVCVLLCLPVPRA